MKTSMLFVLLLALPSTPSFAANRNPPVKANFTCIGYQGAVNEDQEITVRKGEKLVVQTIVPVSAYVWYSNDNLIGTKVSPSKSGGVGGDYTVNFNIDTAKQEDETKTYSFSVAAVWDRSLTLTPPIGCNIVVHLD